MRPRFPLLCLMLLALAACDVFDSITGPDDPAATLSGQVTSTSFRGPYYPATVALLDGTSGFDYEEVNAEGRYRFRDVKPGSYLIVLTLGNRGAAREFVREPIEIRAGANEKNFVVP